jgi:lipid II:glycine glycyltransferase (peptidoglycan interpeptide bridge formation enzyme)
MIRGEVGEGFVGPGEPVEVALDRFYDLLLETGERRDFSFGPRDAFVSWWRAAHRAGYLVLLEARSEAAPLAGLLLYRHGERLSTVHSGDHAAARQDHPGALHLLRWRAIELALREGRSEMDLGGVDVAGARRQPREGEPMWGLYQHKLSFGGTWLELTGAHEKVVRPQRYVAGRFVSRLRRLVGR